MAERLLLVAGFLITAEYTIKGRTKYMAAQITAALLMLILAWFSIHQLMRVRKSYLKIIWTIVGSIAFLSWSGNALTSMGAVLWVVCSVLAISVLVLEKNNASKK